MKLFEIKENEIVFYPKRQTGLMWTIGLGILTLLTLVFLFSLMGGDSKMTIGVGFLIFAIPASATILAFLYSKIEIVVDEQIGNIIRKSSFGNKKLTTLNDIHSIRLTEIQSQYGSLIYICTLVLKDDIYGQGIYLTPPINPKSKELPKIVETILPRINSLLQQTSPIENKVEQEHQIQLFTEEQRDKYVYRDRNFIVLAIGIALFCLFLYLLTIAKEDGFYHYIILLISIFLCLSQLNKLTIDVYKKTIERSNLGIFKTSCHFLEVTDITTVRHLTNGQYTGTEIIAKTNRDKKPYEISLWQMKDTKKVALFIKDVEMLIYQNRGSISSM